MARANDPILRLLEIGLVATLLLAPFPIGSVGPRGRLALETACLLLLAFWLIRLLLSHSTPMPRRRVTAGWLGLLLLGLIQAAPLGERVVSGLSPTAASIRAEARAPQKVAHAEAEILGASPQELAPTATLSLDPAATASAVRTGAALLALLLVATTVTALRGPRTVALALLLSAAFQALYGIVIVVSGYDQIWHLPKEHYLDSATGTFVNRNHFAGLLVMALPVGAALVVTGLRRWRDSRGRTRWLKVIGGRGSRDLILLLLLTVAVAGLLMSLSRAGIALGMVALLATVVLCGRGGSLSARLVLAGMIVVLGLMPLAVVGTERLVDRYADTSEHLLADGARATVWGDTVRMAAAFPVAGSGLGSFAEVYPVFRSPEVRFFFRHAHNDLLQFAAEAGLVGLLLLGLAASALLGSVGRAIGGGLDGIGVGIAIGLVGLALHSMVDFNLHIPANAAVAAALAASLEGLEWQRNHSS